jgi:hypothetical protein
MGADYIVDRDVNKQAIIYWRSYESAETQFVGYIVNWKNAYQFIRPLKAKIVYYLEKFVHMENVHLCKM